MFRHYIWIILMGFAIFYIIKSTKQSQLIKSAKKIDGMVVNHKCISGPNGMMFYAPIYEYEYNEEKHEHISSASQIKPLPIGTKIPLYYNTQKHQIIESTTQIAHMMLGVLFAIGAIILKLVIK